MSQKEVKNPISIPAFIIFNEKFKYLNRNKIINGEKLIKINKILFLFFLP